MTNRTIELDHYRGAARRRAAEMRREAVKTSNVEKLRHARSEKLEVQLASAPARTKHYASEQACYLLGLITEVPVVSDLNKQPLITSALNEFMRLVGKAPCGLCETND
jgi:hypothetical protein